MRPDQAIQALDFQPNLFQIAGRESWQNSQNRIYLSTILARVQAHPLQAIHPPPLPALHKQVRH
jgi:hypothetical protein